MPNLRTTDTEYSASLVSSESTAPAENASSSPHRFNLGATAAQASYCLAPSLQPTFRHSGWTHTRDQVYAAMKAADVSYRRLAAFATCGASWWILRHAEIPDHYKAVPTYCHDRFCTPCARSRAAVIRTNLAARLPSTPLRRLELTLLASDAPLGAQLDRLLTCFRRLRSRRFWRERVRGGAAFLEVTRNHDTGRWHPHLHVIYDGKFIPHETLRSEWLAVTTDSHIVYIQLVRKREHALWYVSKYVTKPMDSTVHRDPEALAVAIKAMAGRKLLHAFGTWSNWHLLQSPTERGWKALAHIDQIRRDAADGDELAQTILTVLTLPRDPERPFVFDLPPPSVSVLYNPST